MVPEDKLYKAEDGAALRFYWGTDRNNFLSEEKGTPVFDNVLYLEIITPGSRESSPVYEVIRRYAEGSAVSETKNISVFQRYERQINAFLTDDTTDKDIVGTALTAAPFLDKAMIATLYEGRIYTIEGLAELSDEKLRVLGMGGRTIRDQARAFVEAAASGGNTAQLAKELADLREEVQLLRNRAEIAETALATANRTAVGEQPPVQVQQPIPPQPVIEAPGGVVIPDLVSDIQEEEEQPTPVDTSDII